MEAFIQDEGGTSVETALCLPFQSSSKMPTGAGGWWGFFSMKVSGVQNLRTRGVDEKVVFLADS